MKIFIAVIGSFYFLGGSVLSAQTPTISQVVDSASFSTHLAPGGLANIIGANFGTSLTIPVTVGGKACAVLSAVPFQIQIEIAVDAPLGPTTIQVGNSAPFSITLTQYAPAVYSADGTGHGTVQAYHADFSAITKTSPASPGEMIVTFAIGMGPTVPVVPTGTASSSFSMLTTTVTATIANKPAIVVFAGLAPGKIGVYQLNLIVPPDITTGDQPFSFSVGEVLALGMPATPVINVVTLPASNAPIIYGLQNNYSYIPSGLPNYGIAQGSIFAIYGSRLAGGSTPVQSAYPLLTSLQGVSVSVTVNGITTHPIPYYLTPNQVAAILPSSTPVGTGQITVTSNGQTGPPAPIQVVQSALGILTLNQAGSGPAAALDSNNNYLGLTNAVHPGEYVNLWGSGLGPVAGDETTLQTPLDLTNIPIEVSIGGITARVTYHGRSIYPGLDQIQVTVPPNVEPGCNVSVVVRTGSIYSNFVTIPVAAAGRTCSEPEFGLTSDVLNSVLSKPSFALGAVNFGKYINGFPQLAPQDQASAQFTRLSPAQFSSGGNLGNVSVGSCIVYYGSAPDGNGGSALDVGPAIDVSGPAGKTTLGPSGNDDGWYYTFDATFPAFVPSAGGTLNFDNGNGGVDVGAFTANLSLGAPLVWSNEASFTTVNRSSGITVAWDGGAPNSFVQITGASAKSGPFGYVSVSFSCAAPVSANQFTVPAAVLLALPATTSATLPGSLSVHNANGQLFTASGLDVGVVTTSVNFTTRVTYQ